MGDIFFVQRRGDPLDESGLRVRAFILSSSIIETQGIA
jgi:hypothetical protein